VVNHFIMVVLATTGAKHGHLLLLWNMIMQLSCNAMHGSVYVLRPTGACSILISVLRFIGRLKSSVWVRLKLHLSGEKVKKETKQL
jgi:hypothetical protein